MDIDTIESLIHKGTHEAWAVESSAFEETHGRPRPLSSTDELIALDNTAFLKNGKWMAEFVIAVFHRRLEDLEERAYEFLEEIVSYLKVKKEEVDWQRIQYFVAFPHQNVNVSLLQAGGTHVFEAGPTYPNGIMSPEIAFPDEGKTWVQGDHITFDVVTPSGFPEKHSLTTIFAQETGWGVISGNDTIFKWLISQISTIQSKFPRFSNGKNCFVTHFAISMEHLSLACPNYINRSSPVFPIQLSFISLLRRGNSTYSYTISSNKIIHLDKSFSVTSVSSDSGRFSQIILSGDENSKKIGWTRFTDGFRTKSGYVSGIPRRRIQKRMRQCF